jgi:multiple sugar transport system ATP-binding protein
LYHHPGNIFVAGFIGSPAMNFFTGSVTGTVDEMYVDSGSLRLPLAQNEIEQLGQESIGREVIFGVRPEDIHHPQYIPGGVNQQKIEATVDVTELMGNEIFVYLQAGEDQNFIARVDPRADMRPGDKVEMVVNADQIHIFDRTTEKNIATPDDS